MKINKTNKLLSLGLVVMSIAGTAQAGDWGIGLNVGQSSLTSNAGDLCDFASNSVAIDLGIPRSTFSCSSDDSDTSVGINLSYDFTDTWGVEVGYNDLGEESSAVNFLGVSQQLVRGEYSAVYLLATGNWNLTDKWSLTGRLGVAKVDLDVTLPITGDTVSDDTTEAMAGFSANYHFNDNWSADLRYDYFDIEDNIDNMSLGIKYHF